MLRDAITETEYYSIESWILGSGEITTAHHRLSCLVQNKMVQVVQSELFVPNGKQGKLCSIKTTRRSGGSENSQYQWRGSILWLMFHSAQCGVHSSPCHFHTSHPVAFHMLSSVLSCSKAQVRSSAGAKPHGLVPQYVGQLGNPGLRLSSRSCYQVPLKIWSGLQTDFPVAFVFMIT